MKVLLQKSKNDLHFMYSHIFINLLRELHIPFLGHFFLTFPWNLMN